MKLNMSEHLLNNILDEDFQKMVFPLNLLQFIFLQPKYKNLNGFVTPNTLRDHLLCLLGPIFITGSGLAKLYFCDFSDDGHFLQRIISLAVLDFVFFVVSSLIVFGVLVAQSKNNVQLILNMQHAYRILSCSDALKRFRKENWIVFAMSILMFISINTGNYFRRVFCAFEVLYIITVFYFDSNMIFAIRIVKFLEHEMKLWLMELYRFQKMCSETNHNNLTNYLEEVKLKRSSLFLAYLDIIEAFKLSSNVFQYSVLLHAAEVCLHPLMYIQQIIEISNTTNVFKHTNITTILSALMPLLWVVKNITLLSCLSAACEQFHHAMADVVAAAAIMRCQSVCILDIKKLCKNVSRVSMSGGADGVLAVRAALPLQLMQLLVAYTVVLLQFAFL